MERLSLYLRLERTGHESVMAWIVELRLLLDIPATLGKIGIDDGKIEQVVRAALKDPTAPTNPVALTESPLTALFRKAVHGQ
jgi:hypothetical protein